MPNTCETCRHFSKIPATRAIHNDCVGECRRRAPTGGVSAWPRTKSVDYCSEFESGAVSFSTVAPGARPGAIIPMPADDAPLHVVPVSPLPAPAPAAGELPLSLDAGQAAPTPPVAAKNPAAHAPGNTRPRNAKASANNEASAPRATGPAGVE